MFHRNSICIGLFFLIFLQLVNLSQQSVSNDVCANAIDLTSQSNSATYTINNANADIPSDSPSISCGIRPYRDMWFKFNSNTGSTENYLVKIDLCSSTIDTVIQVFAGDCNTPICLTSNDDSSECSSSSRSVVSFAASGSTTYYFTVGGITDEVGNIAIKLIRSNNNNCANAAPLSIPSIINAKIVSGTKVDATTPGFTCNGVAVTTTGSWFQFNSGNQTQVSISLCGVPSGFNSMLLLIKSDSCSKFVSSQCYYNNDNPLYCGSGSYGSYLSDVDVDVNTNYYIFVTGTESFSTKSYELKVHAGNDNCMSARNLGSITSTKKFFSGHTTNATYDAPAYLCPNYPQYKNNVWYTFTVSSTSTVEIFVDTNTFDSYIQVFKSTSCAFTSTSCIRYGDNRDNYNSDVFFPVTAGTYYFSVSSASSSNGYFHGTIATRGTSTSGSARISESGDSCSKAIELVFPLGGVTSGQVIVQGTTHLAATSNLACASSIADLYYYFTLPDDATYFSIEVCSFSTVEPKVNIFQLSGSSGCPSSSTPCTGSSTGVTGMCGTDAQGNQLAGTRYTSSGNLPNTRFLFAVSFPGSSSSGQPFELRLSTIPANDLCTNRISLPIGSQLTHMTKYASKDLNIPSCGYSYSSGDVWYSLNSGSNSLVSVSVMSSTFNTMVQVFSGSSCSSLTCLSYNDDYNSANSVVTFPTSLNTEYLIAVSGSGTHYGGFSIAANAVTSPAVNKDINYAIVVNTTNPKPVTMGSHNFLQTSSSNKPNPNPNCGEGTATNGVWFKFNSEGSTSALISLCGSSFSPKFRVFTDPISSPICFSSSSYSAPCNSPYLLSGLTLNTNYYLLVFGTSSTNVGNIALTVTLSPPINDNFANAIEVTLATSIFTGSTVYATPDNVVSCGKTPIFSKNVWYKYDNSILKKTKMTITVSASFNSYLQLYYYSNNQLICIKANDGSGTSSSISAQTITSNTVYYIVVTGVNADDSGSYTLNTYVW